jgi:hypothetical protein
MGDGGRGMSDSNGASGRTPAELATRTHDAIERMAAELRELIAAEQAGRAEYERLVEESRTRERQLQKVLAGLEGQAPTKPGPKRPTKEWRVSDERVARVWEAVQQVVAKSEDGTFISQHVFDVMYPGVSRETITKSVNVLRERELIRRVGTVRGGGIRWALMPGAKGQSVTDAAA